MMLRNTFCVDVVYLSELPTVCLEQIGEQQSHAGVHRGFLTDFVSPQIWYLY